MSYIDWSALISLVFLFVCVHFIVFCRSNFCENISYHIPIFLQANWAIGLFDSKISFFKFIAGCVNRTYFFVLKLLSTISRMTPWHRHSMLWYFHPPFGSARKRFRIAHSRLVIVNLCVDIVYPPFGIPNVFAYSVLRPYPTLSIAYFLSGIANQGHGIVHSRLGTTYPLFDIADPLVGVTGAFGLPATWYH